MTQALLTGINAEFQPEVRHSPVVATLRRRPFGWYIERASDPGRFVARDDPLAEVAIDAPGARFGEGPLRDGPRDFRVVGL